MTDPVDTAQTYGWDTVFTVHIANANAAIAETHSSPLSWTQDDAQDGYSVTGGFGDWSIATGGSGPIIALNLPLKNTIITGPDGATTAVPAGNALINVRLDLLHDAAASNRKHLKVSTTPPGQGVLIANVVGLAFAGPDPGFLNKTVIHVTLQNWLNANLGDFDHVFATIDLDRRAATGAFQWMQPTDVNYAYTDLGSSTDGALAVLNMTGNRSSTALIQQVSNMCIPSGKTASLLIAKQRLIAELLLPCMPLTFAGSKSSDFKLSGTGDTILNAGEGINFTVTQDDGTIHNASVVGLSATVDGTELTFDVTSKVELSPGIRACTRSISKLGITLGKAAGGGQTLLFADTQPPLVTHWIDSDPGLKIAQEILAVAGIIAALAATVMTDGAAAGAIALAIGFAAGAFQVTESAIEMAGANGAPAIGAALLDATAAIAWPASSGFVLTDVQLNDSLQLTGAFS